jgi:predicted ATPase
MLRELHLQNFKGWHDTGLVQLAPLTLLFGSNSSGKSSIEQFFLMLKQTVDSHDRKSVLNAGDDMSPINLGSFDEFIFHRNPQNKLEFRFQWDLPQALVVKDPRAPFQAVGNRMRFESQVGRGGERHGNLLVNWFQYTLEQDGTPQMEVRLERKASAKVEYKLEASPYQLVRKQMKAWPLGLPTKFYGFPEEVPLYYQNAEFVQDFSLEVERLFRSIYYLGPLRSKGRRLYDWTGSEPEGVGYSGENAVSALLAGKDRKFSFGQGKWGKTLHTLIAQKLKDLGLIQDFQLRQISENRKEYEVKVKSPGAGEWVDLPDVGFGVSQVLPVLVQCFYAPPGSIVFIEQPELHLHPRAQTELADLFIDAVSARESGTPRNVQFVIESHSEHLLQRLQRRIAERTLPPEKVAAFFAKATGAHFTLERLSLDPEGNITNWPEDFFGDLMGEAVAMSNAQAQRQPEPTTPQ